MSIRREKGDIAISGLQCSRSGCLCGVLLFVSVQMETKQHILQQIHDDHKQRKQKLSVLEEDYERRKVEQGKRRR